MPSFTERDLLFASMGIFLGLLTWERVEQEFRGTGEGRMSDRLVAAGVLDAADAERLEDLVKRSLAFRGEAGLPGIDRPTDMTEVIRGALSGPDSEATEPLAPTGPIPTPASTTHGDENRFRILRPHAAGGLGEVSLAEDRQLNREVALKEIQRRFADNPASRIRFLLEAEITGGLEHPGIVPVYGLGSHPDGRPYYAMRFIRGDSLKEAIDRFHSARTPGAAPDYAGVEFRGLLGRFVDVCQAIAYAHSRGVLHRDLKPGNVMLGKYGETLVVDWGLARPAGAEPGDVAGIESPLRPTSASGHDLTVAGSAIGTPSYMPPEQAAGKLDELGPQSDVYSLGATLFCILTGRPPVVGDSAFAVLDAVRKGDIPRPRSLQPATPPALEAICLKALALEPTGRYASAAELAADVERALADEPVTAWQEPLPVRVRRWARRHPKSLAAVTATLLVGSVAAGVTTIVVSGKNAELAQSLGREQRAREAESEARTLAETNEEEARSQAELARETLLAVVFDLQMGLENLPGGADVRRRLLRTSLDRLDRIATRFIGDTAVQAGTAQALLELGEVLRRFGPDDDETRVDGRSALAIARSCFERARDITAALVSASPDDLFQSRRLLATHAALAQVAYEEGQYDTAVEELEMAVAIAERGSTADPEDRVPTNDVSICLERLAVVFNAQERADEAERCLRRKLDIDRALAERFPDDPKLRRDLAIAHHLLGDQAERAGRNGEALAAFSEALALREALIADDPDGVRARLDLASSHGSLAGVLEPLGRAAEAIERQRTCVALLETSTAADPDDTQAQARLATACGQLGRLLVAAGDREEGLRFRRQAVAIDERLAAAAPTDPMKRRVLGLAWMGLGDGLRAADALAEAEEAYVTARTILTEAARMAPADERVLGGLADAIERGAALATLSGHVGDALERREAALAVREELVRLAPENAGLVDLLAGAIGALGELRWKAGSAADALTAWRRVLEIRQRRAESTPDNRAEQASVANALERVAFFLRQNGEVDQAAALLDRAIAIHTAAAAAMPQDVQTRTDLAFVLRASADLFLRSDRPAESVARYREAIAIFEQLVTTGSLPVDGRMAMAAALQNLGAALAATGDGDGAVASASRALEIDRALVVEFPDDARIPFDLAVCLDGVGGIERDAGRAEEALAHYREALEIRGRLASDNEKDAQLLRGLMVSQFNVGMALEDLSRPAEAHHAYVAAAAVARRMVEDGLNPTKSQEDLTICEEALARTASEGDAAP
jgi:tetratricopeptide (TPR) repeat protein